MRYYLIAHFKNGIEIIDSHEDPQDAYTLQNEYESAFKMSVAMVPAANETEAMQRYYGEIQ